MTRVYISHSIRGKWGKSATPEQMEANNTLALAFAEFCRYHFPNVDFYVPAEHEDFVYKAYKKGFVTEEQILDIDCEILKECDIILIYAPDQYISNGMGVELKFAVKSHIELIYVVWWADVIPYLNCLLERMKQ